MIKIIAPALIKDRPQTQVYFDIVRFFSLKEEIKKYQIDYEIIKDKDPHIEAINNNIALLPYILKDIQNNDILFWSDARNPLLSVIWKYCLSKKITIRNVGIFWGSSSDNTSFFFEKKMIDYEEYLVKYFDYIFVPTFYLKNIIDSNAKNIIVTSMPLNLKLIFSNLSKENTIIYGHRWVNSKHPESFLQLAKECLDKNINLKFLILNSSNILKDIKKTNLLLNNIIPDIGSKDSIVQFKKVSKLQYYNEIGRAKYVFANSDHETFGYFVLEAVLSGAIPIINNHPCYIELYGKENTYSSINECFNLLMDGKPYNCNSLKNKINNSMPLMYKYVSKLKNKDK